ncbi:MULTISPECIES: tail assembly protein [unclassified Caballeronia]|uniref:tail assembly protein n=1 Tax=unclassified Caballeronia TaxID=2646786 RepID=UPI0028647FBB|nr:MULTISPECIES: tail assembly protein [unclassified Caballeronia]MDR5774918.1 tail assembly protein [Caballeronia sp. LZ002]MDR5850354.1 tail assembly protein [Caballeronia sp. LZ003]
MSDKLRTIRLYGPLSQFGRVHRLAVSSTSEAVRALSVIVPGFKRFMLNAKDNGLTFAVFNGKRNLGEDQLPEPVGDDEIRIAPIIIGSKSGGLFQTLLGAALIAASFFVPAGGAFGIAALSQGAVFGLGASMALGGVVQMLSPQTSGLASSSGDNGTSYYFNGAVNSAAQGDCVPIVYGRMRVGSKRASAGIYAEDQA